VQYLLNLQNNLQDVSEDDSNSISDADMADSDTTDDDTECSCYNAEPLVFTFGVFSANYYNTQNLF